MFNPNLSNLPTANPWRDNQSQAPSRNPIIIDSESEEEEPHPGVAAYNRMSAPDAFRWEDAYLETLDNNVNALTGRPHVPVPGPGPGPGPGVSSSSTPRPNPFSSASAYTIPSEQEKRTRSRLREERHAALCVLTDRELLTTQALAAQETIPQARRRFLSTLISPSDPITATSIRADQFTVQRRASSTLSPFSTEPMLVSRGIVDVCEGDDSGWYKPELDLASGSAMGMSSPSASSSPVSSAKLKGRGTPERSRANRRVSGRQQQQTRERRRRWSGAERQDYGPGASF
ncbi:uncharacterized protein DSM5745_02217 [Aspergillus mulundensis]|uniref:Uncharacterized protein n=1 Tax=Aspergillus mulundensis TaxID=1810919 RepID=A0A3D8SVV2_9EURO|nr:Uncharacterized protein DSM5745_02217 [Aspergillus mulundensis]RDW90442.1 Uncharacterized protein DSM5745_02217 [Aspergillus mulundensis]